ncbi:sensor histidine kinase [Sphingomonas sp.]|uniref:sensor histidine kinase n=1 Tax=Sphingomonas sp. TaxID=28214 RepID=UPI0038B3DF2E
MRFDDRLLTVLNQPAEDRHDAAVRWRQLVDLVARAGAISASPVLAEALAAIRDEAARVDEGVRAATARSVAALPLPLGLLEYFASDTLSVSAPVLAAATLDSWQWRALGAVGDDETNTFIATLHPEIRAEPHAEAESRQAETVVREATLVGAADRPTGSPSLQDVIERIERRRRLRSDQPAAPSQSAAPVAGSPALFRWECGPGGEIAWVEGAPRGPLIGRSIARQQENDGDRVDVDVVRAFAARAPFRDASLRVGGAGPVAGEWKISGVPAFEPSDGRFAGYRGVALRDTPAAVAAPQREMLPDVLSDPDSVRELVHEIKTPLNAIMGFAEIIEGQYLGPADRGYRERAAEIGRQARLLLTATDDLDFAAKVHSSIGDARERVDLGALVERAGGELRDMAGKRGVEATIVRARREVAAAVEPELADRLLFRLFGALADRAERGERLQVSAEQGSDGPRISISRPAALKGIGDPELFEGAGVEGAFSLRLARGLARIAGGDLVSSRDTFALLFRRA